MKLNKLFAKKPTESPAAMLKRTEAEIKAEEMRVDHAQRMAERRRQLTETRVETIKVEAETVKTLKSERREEIVEKIVGLGPLFVISGLAITGQYGKFAQFMTVQFGQVPGTIVAGLCALALELIALLFGFYGMRALRRKDSAAGLLLAATAVAGLVAWMNFDFYKGWVGVTFGLFSFVAPFLWRTKIRSDHRDELVQNGEIETRGLKLPRVMWFMHPIKSYKVYRHASWTGTRDVALAITEWEDSIKPVTVEPTELEIELDTLQAMIIDLRGDLDRVHADAENEKIEINTRTTRQITSGTNGYPVNHPKWAEAVAMYEASVDAGEPMKVGEIASQIFGTTNRVNAGKVVQFVKERRDSERRNGSDLTPETA